MTQHGIDLEQLAIDTIRTLSMDGVQAANSGHPGTPMALAPVAYLLFNEVMRYDPAAPDWPNRDRFILSCGHASMLLFSTLHLAGVRQLGTDEPAVTLDDLKRFRQLGSRCPGHPEYRHTSGVELTTGPLGQGVGSSVGMAIASRWLAATYNRPGFDLFDFNVYALCSDGDLMEGLGGEAASLAGHLKLSNLCWIYDDNQITIEGSTSLAYSDNVAARFSGYGWNVVEVEDVNDLDALRGAIDFFHEATDGPTLIVVKSKIAYGAPKMQGTADAHGAPLGEDEVRATKTAYGWPPDEHFRVSKEVLEHFRQGIGARGQRLRSEWDAQFAKYATAHPAEAGQLDLIRKGALPEGFDAGIPAFPADPKGIASRASSGKVLNAVAKSIPWMLGGSADLAPSNKSRLEFEGAGDFSADNPAGRNFHFGVREHAMAAATNGMALCGLRPYAATFFVFADYLRPSARLAAIMGLPVLYIFTHDSIGVGEDGPTHQPVEQLASLRAIPGMVVLRPADANEVAESYRAALRLADRPAAIVLTRQNLPTVDRAQLASAEGVQRGGYVLSDPPDGPPKVILIGTGSEVSLCLEAQAKLAAEGVPARVVSLPSWELFDAQDAAYRDSVLPPGITARVGVEMGVEMGWGKYLGPAGRFVGMKGFGASGPYKALFEHFGFTPQAIVAAAKESLAGK
ncbi:MAG: transketolase [Pirellulales bacterium]|nr:transketolase [Pirellulales bacterium]